MSDERQDAAEPRPIPRKPEPAADVERPAGERYPPVRRDDSVVEVLPGSEQDA